MRILPLLLILTLLAGCEGVDLSEQAGPPVAPSPMVMSSDCSGVTNKPCTDSDGAITYGISTISISGNTTLTAGQCRGQHIILTGDGTTVTMPAVSGLVGNPECTFMVGDATAKHIDVNASDRVLLRSTALDDGDKVSIGASNTGKMIKFWNNDSDGWATGNAPGEFTDGGA